jgi:hypothetical protein
MTFTWRFSAKLRRLRPSAATWDQNNAYGKSGLDAVRDIFLSQRNATVTEDHRIIRVRIGQVPDTIVQTRMSPMTLDTLAQYNGALAIAAIVHNQNVQDAMHKRGLSVPTLPVDMLLAPPNSIEPHLSSAMKGVTMDQALDEVATTFKGIVFYGACRGIGRFEVSFDGSPDFHLR